MMGNEPRETIIDKHCMGCDYYKCIVEFGPVVVRLIILLPGRLILVYVIAYAIDHLHQTILAEGILTHDFRITQNQRHHIKDLLSATPESDCEAGLFMASCFARYVFCLAIA